jgi:hypothetical protein
MTKIVDLDDLSYVVDTTAGGSDEVEIQTGAKTIQLLPQGVLDDDSPGSTSGVTGQCIYSLCKEIWKDDDLLNPHLFPIQMLYDESFLWINGWGPFDAQTRDLFRDAGFKETDDRENACIVSLGSMDDSASDQAYYTNVIGFDQSKADFDKTGELNENIQIIGSGGSPDNSGYMKAFLREEQKTFDSYELVSLQGLSAIAARAYRLPLSNGDDSLNAIDDDTVIVADAGSISGVVYSELEIDYIVGNGFTTAAVTTYAVDDVVQDGDTPPRWARCTGIGDISSAEDGPWASFVGSATWEAYPGERLIGTAWYAFNRVLNVQDVGTTSARLKEIHSWAQWKCRQAADINDDGGGDAWGTVNGNIALQFTDFIGDTLHTFGGVFIEDFDGNDVNDIRQWDITVDSGGLDAEGAPVISTARQYPFTAAGNMNFSQNFVDEVDATTRYTMYFAWITDTDLTDLKVTGAAGASATLDWSGNVGLLDHLLSGDFVAITGFTTETDNNGLWEITGAPSSNTVTADKVDGINPTTEAVGDAANVKENPFESPGAIIVDDNSVVDIDGEIASASIGWDYDFTNNVQGGRTADTEAEVVVVGIAYDGAQYVPVYYTITKTTGQAIPVNAVDELNYLNP